MNDNNMKGPNFLPKQLLKSFSTRKRKIIGISVASGTLLVVFLFLFTSIPTNIANATRVLEPLKVAEEITIEPEQEVVLSTPKPKGPKAPEVVGPVPYPNNFSAEAMIVVDNKTGKTLYGKNEYKVWPIASITKLMSALVLLDQDMDWSAPVTVVQNDLFDNHMIGGEIYTVEELWKSALIASSNKAIVSLAKASGLSMDDFVEAMNKKAQELGMTQSNFVETTGLNSYNQSSPADIVLLLKHALAEPKIQGALLEKDITIIPQEKQRSHKMFTTNLLLRGWVKHDLPTFLGGKTGYIGASGYNFVMQAADEYGNVVDVVVLGTNSNDARFVEARDIVMDVFEAFKWENEVAQTIVADASE